MLVTIITINFNNLEGLKKTMVSVLEQTYSNIEYIVIDGGSTDGSKEYIQKNQDDLVHWVSEPDEGIYSALNKGIDRAKGEYLLFLNSGDWLIDDLVIEKFDRLKPVEDFVYGDAMLTYKNGRVRYKKMPSRLEEFVVFHQTITHQSMFIKRTLFDNGAYDLKYTIVADWVFYNSAILINKKSYRHVDLIIANYDGSGLSSDSKNKARMQVEREMFYIENSSYFVPLLLERYESTVRKYQNLQKPILVQLAIKISKKIKLVKSE